MITLYTVEDGLFALLKPNHPDNSLEAAFIRVVFCGGAYAYVYVYAYPYVYADYCYGNHFCVLCFYSLL